MGTGISGRGRTDGERDVNSVKNAIDCMERDVNWQGRLVGEDKERSTQTTDWWREGRDGSTGKEYYWGACVTKSNGSFLKLLTGFILA